MEPCRMERKICKIGDKTEENSKKILALEGVNMADDQRFAAITNELIRLNNNFERIASRPSWSVTVIITILSMAVVGLIVGAVT